MSSQSLCARVTATEVSALASICWLHATPEKQHAVMIAIVSWIVVLELATPIFSTFAARKLCHAGCGLGIMCLDSQYLISRYFVWAIAAGSILMTWNLSPLPPFRFSRERDVGITLYLLLVSTWFALQLPALLLAPLFFADPAGAVVGKALSRHLGPRWNPAWVDQKTIGGSCAVFALTWLTITYDCSPLQRCALAALATLAEAVGGEYDNLAIGAVVLFGWLVF